MKKRIGTKLYDTDTSEKIADVGVGILYRKRTRKREWFLLIGDYMDPIDDKQAKALLGEDVRVDKEPESDKTTIWVDRETHKKIADKADAEGLPISQFVKKWANETLH